MRRALALLVMAACGAGGDDDDGSMQVEPGADGGGGAGDDGGGVGEGIDGSLPGDTYTLTVSVVGQGNVVSAPEGIRCANPQGPETSACAVEFGDGETVTLSAVPSPGQAFAGWAGDCDGSGDCTLVLDEPRYAAATFQAAEPPSTCPTPATGTVSLCGRVYDLEDTTPAGGVRLLFFDAEQFLGGTSAPMAGMTVPANGKFTAADLPPAPSGKFVIATDDTSGLHDRALTGVVVAAAVNTKADGIEAFTLRRTTDDDWMVDAGDPFAGLTFSVQGVLVGIFIDKKGPVVGPFAGTPRAGVTITAGGAAHAADDYYFTDTGALSRRTPAAAGAGASATGANGSALLVRSGVGPHSGTGGGCTWPTHTVASVPDAVVVQVFETTCP